MQNLLFFDTEASEHLLPITYTRPASEIRVGILSIKEKWLRRLKAVAAFQLPFRSYLESVPQNELNTPVIGINGRLLPTEELQSLALSLSKGTGFQYEGEAILFKGNMEDYGSGKIDWQECPVNVVLVNRTYDTFRLNGDEIKADFKLITEGRKSQPLPDACNYLNADNIFIEEGARILMSNLNASDGPIYIGKDALVMEGSNIRGPFALCEGSLVKMGTKIYQDTTVGVFSKVGGELNNVVIQGYSNKGHDGFLGNAYIGEWCNLGADTNNSNLKNNYDQVRLWNEVLKGFEKTGLQFCGLIMADHSKSGINTMFNTGTVIGVGCNIFGSGFPRNYIPSFSWGGKQGFQEHRFNKFIHTAEIVMNRRNKELSDTEIAILQAVYNETVKTKN